MIDVINIEELESGYGFYNRLGIADHIPSCIREEAGLSQYQTQGSVSLFMVICPWKDKVEAKILKKSP